MSITFCNVVVKSNETKIEFSEIIKSKESDEILEYAKNNILNQEQINQIKDRLIELKDMRAYSRFIIEFGTSDDINNFENLTFSDRNYNRISTIMHLPDMKPFMKYGIFSTNSAICRLMRLIGFYGEIANKNENNQEIIQMGQKLFDNCINEFANWDDKEFNFSIDMLTNSLNTIFVDKLQISSKTNILYNLELDYKNLSITLDEVYKTNPYVSLIIGNTSIVERLKEARKKRFAFKPGEASCIKYTNSSTYKGISR